MKVSLLLVIVVLAVSVFAADPAKPVWPKRFSSSVRVQGWEDGREHDSFFRWFYDANVNKDRIDGLGYFEDELYFAERIFDHKADKRYDVFFQDETVLCFVRPINNTLPKPSFANARFIGKAIIDYTPVFHWIEESPDRRFVFQYYDTQDTRKPMRMDVADNGRRRAMTWYFHEFDQCNQDPNLFILPQVIMDQCNSL